MNIQFQRAVDRHFGVPICALFSLIERVRCLFGRKSAVEQPRRILIILLSEMGSLVLAQPMFAELKRRYPDAQLHMLMFRKNREVLDLLEVMPKEHVLTLNDRSLFGLIGDSIKVLRAMHQLKFEVVIDCELFSRVSSIFSYLSGAPVRVGFYPHTQEGLYRGTFMNRKVMYNPYRHLSQQFLTMVEAIQSDARPVAKAVSVQDIPAPPPLRYSQAEMQQVTTQFYQDFPMVQGKKLVLVYPSGGILPIRAWPPEYYKELCAGLLARGYAVGIIGMKEDQPLAQEIIAHCQSELCINLAGYTRNVRHLLALFQFGSLLITNDGGPGQFAALTPIPALIFFGPETPLLYRSNTQNSHYFHTAMSCSPCLTAYNHRLSPCDGDNQCLKQIKPDVVLAKALEKLST